MTTHHFQVKPQTMSGWGVITKILVLLIIFVASGLVGVVSPLAGVLFFFLALLAFIWLGFKKHQGRNLWLLLYCHLPVLLIAANIAFFLPVLRQFAAFIDPAASTAAALALAIVVGIVAAVALVTVPFLVVVALATYVYTRLHQTEGVSFWQNLVHVLTTILGINFFLIVVEGGEQHGTEEAKKLLKYFGGPGWLVIYPGQVVALHKHGKITRVKGVGSVMLERSEKIKAIMPLDIKANLQTIKNVLTRDRIALSIDVLHVVQIESAAETKSRLEQAVEAGKTTLAELRDDQAPAEEIEAAEQSLKAAQEALQALEEDSLVGDDDDKCYESVARTVARKAPEDIWDALKGMVAANMRDVVMSEFSEKLFEISNDEGDLEARINERKIAEIEKLVLEKTKITKLKEGLILRVVDIHTVKFPPEIEAKIKEDIKTQIEQRIQETKAHIAEFEAKAKIIGARANAESRILEGQAEGEAQATLFREILRELSREDVLTKEEIGGALLRLITSSASIKELQSFFKAAKTGQGQPIFVREEKNGAQQNE